MGLERVGNVRLDGDVGNWIGRIRTMKGLTQTQLAARAGTAQSAVSRLETGKVSTSLGTLDRLGRALGVKFVLSLEEVQDDG